MTLTWEQFARWLDGYFAAWKSNNPDEVAALFADDAVYHYGPFKEPAVGRQQIVANWIADPMQQQNIRTTYKPLALNGNLGVAHWAVSFRSGEEQVELDGILVLTFDEQGRCLVHREWYDSRVQK